MLHETILFSDFHSSTELCELLNGELNAQLAFELRPPEVRVRGAVDPAILVAIATSPALAALVTGLLRLVEMLLVKKPSQAAKIVVHGPSGSMEFDPGMGPEKLKELLEVYERFNANRIEIVRK